LKNCTLFQTLEDRDNPEYIESNGPFDCNWPNTWLGSGYYFWDTFVKNAHWWGSVRYNVRDKNYVICQAECSFDEDTCFDLAGNTKHLMFFSEVVDFMEEKGLLDRKKHTVSRVINYLRDNIDFKYEAIRVYGVNSISQRQQDYLSQMKFEKNKSQYLDFNPPFQFCIFKKTGLKLKNYKIIFPDHYIDVVI